MAQIDLNIWPWSAWDDYKDVFRAAKQGSPALAQILLQPRPAVPGCGRLIAFGSRPPFAAEYIVVRKSTEELEGGLALRLLDWYVGNHEEPLATTVAGWLSLEFGRKVVEIG